MRLLLQIFVILLFYCLGELLSCLMGHFIPGSVLGMLLLFVALSTGLLRIGYVDSTATFLTRNMGLFFVPAGVGLLTQIDLIARYWPLILISVVLSTVLVIIVVATTQQRFERRKESSENTPPKPQ